MNGKNIAFANSGDIITIGRMKGKISSGDKIFKLTSTNHSKRVYEYFNKENKKIPLSAIITIKKDVPISLEVTSSDKETGNYFSMSSSSQSDIVPVDAINNPITKDRIIEQLKKTTDTPFEFKYIKVDLDENIYIPKISALNQLRRDCLNDLENQAIKRFERDSINIVLPSLKDKSKNLKSTSKEVSLLLNELNPAYNYDELVGLDNIYIPLKYFLDKKHDDILHLLSKKFNMYIYLPVIIKDNFRNVIFNNFSNLISSYNIKGIVITNIAGVDFYNKYSDKLEIIANFNLNVFNKYTAQELSQLGVSRITLSPELDEESLKSIASSNISTELQVYGKLPIMNSGYCLLGTSNRCYPTCEMKCLQDNKFYLKDRLGLKFRVVPDNLQTVTTIYNSKITSIKHSNVPVDCVRISILDEDIKTINDIITKVKKDIPFSGKDYTKGNFDKQV